MKSKLPFLSLLLFNTYVLFAQVETTTLIHKVEEKENLYRIALKYGTNIQQIEALNPTLKSEKIKIGMKLTVPVPAGGVSAILPGPARAPKAGVEAVEETRKKNINLLVTQPTEQPIKKNDASALSYLQKNNSQIEDFDSVPIKRSGKVVKKTLNTSFEKPEKLSLDFTRASSAEERKNELLQLAKRDHSIVVVTTLNGTNSFLAQEEPSPVKLLSSGVPTPTSIASQQPIHERKSAIEHNALSNPPSAASLRRVLLAAERGEDMIVNLQIIMKDGAVICVTDPSLQLQMVSELLQAQR